MSLYRGAVLVEVCGPAPPPAGGDRSLLHYQSHCLRHNLPVMGTIDLLHRLYTTKWPPAVAARSVGLQLVEAVKPLKVRWLAMFVQAPQGLSTFPAPPHRLCSCPVQRG